MSEIVASLMAMFGGDTSQFDTAAGRVESKMTSTGTKVQKTGMVMTMAFGPAAAALTGAANAGYKYDASLANIAAVTGQTREESAALGQELLNIGVNTTAGPQAVAEAYYDVVGGVTDASARMDILNASIDTAEAGQANLGATTGAMISVMNSYASANLEASTASDVLTRTVGMGVGSMDQFAAAMPAVTGLAASMGISFEDVGAQMAFLTTKGFSASQSATMLSGSITALIKPNADMAAAIADAGYESGQAMLEAEGLQGSYQLLVDTGADIPAITGNVEALNGVTALLGEDAPQFMADFKDGVEGATDAAKAIQMEAPSAQMELLKSKAEGLGIQLGSALIPILGKVVDKVTPIVTAVADWVSKNPELAGTIGAVVMGLGALGLVMAIVGPIIGGIAALVGLIGAPVLLVIAAVALLAVAWKTNFLGIRTTVTETWEHVKEFVGGIAGDISGALSPVTEAAASLGNAIWDGIMGALNGLKTALINLINDAIPDRIDLGPLGSIEIPQLSGGGDSGGGGNYTGGGVNDMAARAAAAFSAQTAGSSAVGGGRAGGGVVIPGQYYEANEVWAEGFTPLTAGKVTPLGAGGSGGGTNTTINIQNVTVQDTDPQRWLDRLKDAARQRGDRVVLSL